MLYREYKFVIVNLKFVENITYDSLNYSMFEVVLCFVL